MRVVSFVSTVLIKLDYVADPISLDLHQLCSTLNRSTEKDCVTKQTLAFKTTRVSCFTLSISFWALSKALSWSNLRIFGSQIQTSDVLWVGLYWRFMMKLVSDKQDTICARCKKPFTARLISSLNQRNGRMSLFLQREAGGSRLSMRFLLLHLISQKHDAPLAAHLK